MKKRKGKPAGMNYADVLERKRLIRQAVQDEVILHEVNISMPVSYTHLDVYKRQPERSSIAAVMMASPPAEHAVLSVRLGP